MFRECGGKRLCAKNPYPKPLWPRLEPADMGICIAVRARHLTPTLCLSRTPSSEEASFLLPLCVGLTCVGLKATS